MSSLDPSETSRSTLRQRTTRRTALDEGSGIGHVDNSDVELPAVQQQHALFDRSKAFMVEGRPTTEVAETETHNATQRDMLQHIPAVPLTPVAPGPADPALPGGEHRTPNNDHDPDQGDEDNHFVHEYLTGRRSSITNSDTNLDSTAVDPPTSTPAPTETSTSDESKPTAEAPAGSRPTSPVAEEEKICRICFDGEDPDLGRLFSPCKCRGTSKHVHVSCLSTWRAQSARTSCEQCQYQYKFRRTAMASVISHRATLMSLTVVIFMLLVWIAGYGANLIIRSAENHRSQLSGSLFEDLWISDHVILGEGVKEAIDFFGNKIETTKWAKEVLRKPLDHDGQAAPLREIGILSGAVGKEACRVWFVHAILHFFKGLSLVGLLSSFHTFIATSFISPVGRGLFRFFRPAVRHNNARNRPGQRDGNGNLSQLVVVIFVLVGAVKAVAHTYQTVKWVAKKALTKVEDLVLDI